MVRFVFFIISASQVGHLDDSVRDRELPVERIEFDLQTPIVVPVYLDTHLFCSHVLSESEQLMPPFLVLLMSDHADHFMVARPPSKIRNSVASQSYRLVGVLISVMCRGLKMDHFVSRDDYQPVLDHRYQRVINEFVANLLSYVGSKSLFVFISVLLDEGFHAIGLWLAYVEIVGKFEVLVLVLVKIINIRDDVTAGILLKNKHVLGQIPAVQHFA